MAQTVRMGDPNLTGEAASDLFLAAFDTSLY